MVELKLSATSTTTLSHSMSKQLHYRLYSGDLATYHESNKLDELIKLGELLGGVLGEKYTVRDLSGQVVWEEDKP